MTSKPPQASLVATDTGYRASYDDTGYVAVLGPYAVLVLGLLCWIVYAFWVDPARSVGMVFFAACLLAPLIALGLYLAREFTSSVDFTPTRITHANLFGTNSMNWADIGSVAFAPRSYAMVLRTKSGRTMRLPRLNGCEVDLERCVRRYLPGLAF